MTDELCSDAEKPIFKAIVLRDIEPALLDILKINIDVYFKQLPSGKLPDFYIIDFNDRRQPGSIYADIHRKLKAPILLILEPKSVSLNYSVLNVFGPRNTTAYLLNSSVPVLWLEAAKNLCQNLYFCDPDIKQIKIPKQK